MSTWQYRAVRVPDGHGGVIRLAEVHYAEGTPRIPQWPGVDHITGWAWASGPQGDSREDLAEELALMAKAVHAPIIDVTLLPGWKP